MAQTEAEAVWSGLSEPWRVSLEEAWASWSAGSAGIGAVVVDSEGAIVSRGRNRSLESPSEPGVLAGTLVAHAEMNALAGVPLGRTPGLTLYTTLEPCLMCAATMVMLKVGRVRYAASDPMFHGVRDALSAHPFCEGRIPVHDGPFPGPIGVFARILPLTTAVFWGTDALETYRRQTPSVVELAETIVADGGLADLAQAGASAVEAVASLWEVLEVRGGESMPD